MSHSRKLLVLGNGPSLKKEHFPLFRNVATLGMNAAYRFWRRIDWYPTLYCCLDDQVVLSHADEIRALISEDKCEKFFLHQNALSAFPELKDRDNVFFLPQMLHGQKHLDACKALGLPHIANEFFKTKFGSKVTTGAYAIRFAASMGYDDIGLVGIDCRYKEVINEAEVVDGIVLRIAKTPETNPNYFFEDYQKEGDVYNVPNPEVHNGNLHLQAFESLKSDYDRLKIPVRIQVCTQESELYDRDVFAYKELNAFVGKPRLSAVFTPFVRSDAPRLLNRFKAWGADRFAPYAAAPSSPRVALRLAYNHGRDAQLEQTIKDAFNAAKLSRYFSDIAFHYSNLSGLRDLYTRTFDGPVGPEGYMAGPNNQFFDIIRKFSRGMSHIVMIEPDVAPLRPGWLQRIEDIVQYSDKFWLCGSHYRGRGDVKALWHVNGNAIYNVGDLEFQNFFERKFLPHFRKRMKEAPWLPYDIILYDMFRNLFSDSKPPDVKKLWSDCAHRVRFSDFIVDVSHDEDRKPENLLDLNAARVAFPDACLFHGAVDAMDRQIDDIVAAEAENGGETALEPQTTSARVLLLDPDALDWFGHYMAYNDKLTLALEACGADATVVCNANLDKDILEQRPNFLPRFTVESRFIGKELDNEAAMSIFEQELASTLSELASSDPVILYMYCGSFSHLEIILRQINKYDHIYANMNLFYESFQECHRPEWRERWRATAKELARVGANRIKVTTPTARLRDHIENVTGMRFDVAPHPSTALSDDGFLKSLPDAPSAAASRSVGRLSGGEKFTVVFPGSARRGKGFASTVDVVDKVAADLNVRVIMRTPHPEDVKRFQTKIDRFHTDVEVVSGALSNEDYLALYRKSHASVLLYDPEAFAMRTSGLFIDSLYHGLPIVALKSSWLGDIVERHQCGVAIEDASAESVSDAVRQIFERYDVFAERAVNAAHAYFMENSWEKLAQFLIHETIPADHEARVPTSAKSSASGSAPRRMLIIGNGPSTREIAEIGFDKLPADVDTFGMGAAYRFFERVDWWPTYYALADSKVVHSQRYSLTRLIESPTVTTQQFFFPLRLSSNPKLTVIPHSSTGDFCLRKSVELGYKEIFLIGIEGDYVEEISESRPLTEDEFDEFGFDQLNLPPKLRKLLIITKTPEKNPNYFFDDYQQAGDIYSLPQAQSHRKSWSILCNTLSEIGQFKIYNLSKISKINDFPRGSLTAFMEGRTFSAGGPASASAAGAMERPRIDKAYVDETKIVAHLLSDKRGPAFSMADAGIHADESADAFRKLDWTVHRFEPDPETFAMPTKRLAAASRASNVPDAAGDKADNRVHFFKSGKGAGLFGLDNFRDGRDEPKRIETATIADMFKERNIERVDFLNIDVEGFDLAALKDMPWDKIKPDVVKCAFKEATAAPLGFSWRDIADYLREKGYAVYISEWHPIVRRNILPDWRRVLPCADADLSDSAWGKVLAFRNDPGYDAVCAAFKALTEIRPAAPPPSEQPKPAKRKARAGNAPSRSKPAAPAPGGAAAAVKRPPYARIGDWIMRRSPRAFGALRFAFRGIAGLWRRRIWTGPALVAWLLIASLGFVPAFVPFRQLIWIGSAFALLLFMLLYLALRVHQHINALSAEVRTFRTETHKRIADAEARTEPLSADIKRIAKKAETHRDAVLTEMRSLASLNALEAAKSDLLAALEDVQSRGANDLNALKTVFDEHAKQNDTRIKRHAERIKQHAERIKQHDARIKQHDENIRRQEKAFEAGLEKLSKTKARKSDLRRLSVKHEAIAETAARKSDVDAALSDSKEKIAGIKKQISAQAGKSERLQKRIASSEKQIGEIRYPDAPRCIVFFGHHKCGSRFFRQEIFTQTAEMCGGRLRQYEIQDPPFHYSRMDELDLCNIDFQDLGVNERDVVLFANATGRSLDKIKTSVDDWKGVRIVRDPRQVLVSNYFHHKGDHDTEFKGWIWDWLVQDKPILRDLSEEEGLLYELDNISKHVIEDQVLEPFDDDRIMTIKLEDFSEDPERYLLQISEFLGVSDIAGISLEATHANPDSGLWRRHFTSRLRETFKERYGQALIDMKYAEDFEW